MHSGFADKFLLRTMIGSSDGNQAFIVNLRSGTLLGRVSTEGVKDDIRALPDGRLYKINSVSGRIDARARVRSLRQLAAARSGA